MRLFVFIFLMATSFVALAGESNKFFDKAAVGALGGILLVVGWFLLVWIERVWNLLVKPPSNYPLKVEMDGVSELMKSAASGDLERVATLIESGIEINETDSQSATALMFAAENGRFDVVSLLLTKGADKELKSLAGFTAMQYANAYESDRHAKTTKLLKKWKALSPASERS